ncbi:MAG: bestrophin family ion channel [Cyanobacteria bacterium J06621_11]
MALVSVVLLGVEEIGNEIEDSFGYDFNDLKLDDICATLLQDIKSVLSFSEEGILVNEPILESEDDASDSEADTEGLRTANAA